ncbi:2'-5' RNA ligase family protein [Paenibacillus prosopidis]|uniref:2'-5' RNA ligase superfamily protein n=1 Tax=Paenibacillus prosopidis TaxID=630520 RepID=A0A368VEN8_9BACL|nr:2'-5' RNA ligase family protein [Paenibacillus prosopidis]RCW39727.1 2'-5' RNA ligase superfamily protein [Paenibacillus prosopidis]
MYAVEFFFEESFEQYVKGIWKGLHDEKITSNMYEISEIRPHITVAVYNDIPDLEMYFTRFNSFFKDVSELEIKFDVLASFPTSGTLFIDPTVTEGLIKLHKQFHKEFEDLLEFANQYYIPNNWDPHCTVAIRLNSELMIEAMKYCYQDFTPHKSKIVEVGLVKLGFKSNKCISSPTIMSNVFKALS